MADIRDGGAEAHAGPEGCPKQTIQTVHDRKSPRLRPTLPLQFTLTALYDVSRDRDRDITPAKHTTPDDPALAAARQEIVTKMDFGPSKFTSPVYEPSPAEMDKALKYAITRRRLHTDVPRVEVQGRCDLRERRRSSACCLALRVHEQTSCLVRKCFEKP